MPLCQFVWDSNPEPCIKIGSFSLAMQSKGCLVALGYSVVRVIEVPLILSSVVINGQIPFIMLRFFIIFVLKICSLHL